MGNNRWLYGILLLVACGCGEHTVIDQPIPEPTTAILTAAVAEGNVDLGRSVIHWKGTKMGQMRHHEGYLKLRSGHLEVEDGRIRSGYFMADMATLQVTDIPAHEIQARANLVKHLKSDFDAKRFPYSRFTIKSVRQPGNQQQVCGDLQIRDIVQRVCFEVMGDGYPFTADLVLNRSDWQIGAAGGWLGKRLVDDTFYLKVDLYVK
jgi:hypothetical protein